MCESATRPVINKDMPSLLQDILSAFLPQFAEGISEFDIISLLKQAPYSLFDEDALRDSLILFQTHFVLFHALYNLRNEWRQQKIGELDIGPTIIKLKPLLASDANIAKSDPLADYYLDWQNFAATTKDDVNDLLDGFWQAMAGAKPTFQFDEQSLQNAANKLNITDFHSLSLAQLKLQYHKMQHNNHPDKGGSVEQSQLISQAYTILRKYLSN